MPVGGAARDFDLRDATPSRRRHSAQSLGGSIRYPHERRFTSVNELLYDFCSRTSSHGIPHVGESFTPIGKIFWIVVFIACSIGFLICTHWSVSEYLRYKTIIEMQLKFEAAPFPAVTICNLNPYKLSLVQNVSEIQQSLNVFDYAIAQPKVGSASDAAAERRRRSVAYEPALVHCKCTRPRGECVPVLNPLERSVSVCLCFEDTYTAQLWPCYLSSIWTEALCADCAASDSCAHPAARSNASGELTTPCVCQTISNYCMVLPSTGVRWWKPAKPERQEVTAPQQTTSATPPPDVVEAMGMTDTKDKGAITTRTRETVMFVAASLPVETRVQMSYTQADFVRQCSFNGKDCDNDKDFQLHVDPVFGNCYTFNYNDSVELKNSRAGPMYGLRLLLDVNQAEYMQTTEAAGVRLVVHEQDEQPYPDTFGYSAPTGTLSSFGLKTKVLSRMPPPHGNCAQKFVPSNYIYEARTYSTEGCFRNCFQHRVVERCGCGDPRFPLPLKPYSDERERACKALDQVERQCLTNITTELGGYHHIQSDCHCVQPCRENVFETAYSAAAWPAKNYRTSDCPTEYNDTAQCLEYFRKNTAYIEVYYEQLNFEILSEIEAYSVVNLLSDFGGNIGLFIGFSVITMVECLELFLELFYLCYFRKKRTRRRRQSNKQLHYVNQIVRGLHAPTNFPNDHYPLRNSRYAHSETDLLSP